ncbi:dienelactone hydrolase family protein [Acinetobacter rongchengensis]|uniref:Dienelactone hydrolase family protein n=1 Tax=Acinetobacter rongchengensis TaxID=2419601 RepID=A0A3A8EMB0_9GAMM|nr:dienelactone hydrolase family protein [Acinetobacter rongchengensis]RKG35298.1 dienelactone hydrolase family protein [Acinetobacter rongchengensis]
MVAAIKTREITYTAADGSTLIGYFAAPESVEPVAGIIVGPEWWGRNEYTEQRTHELAEHGFAALAIDMYGDKKTTVQAAQANEWMTQTFQENTIVERANAGLTTLAAQPEVDATRLAAIGFCYGGKVILDLARSGADLKAAITFHANLSAQQAAKQDTFKAEVLVLHGELDSMVSLADVESFKQEMNNAHITNEVIVLKDAKHGFSNPLADERAKANNVDLGYNAEAEQKGLAAMYAVLDRVLA